MANGQVLPQCGKPRMRAERTAQDGLGKEFYERNWTLIQDDLRDVLNQMFWDGKITSRQKHGILICLPKPRGNPTPADYCPITLLNSYYKILARMFARRLRPIMEDHLTYTQYCGIPGNTILDAIATVRDSIAYAENKNTPSCVLSPDFKNAYDRVLHGYLFKIIHGYGIGAPFIKGIQHMYEGATSSIQINGNQYGPIPVRCAVRQRCPMSMALYTLGLHPLLKVLEQNLPGLKMGKQERHTSVIAYADDVTIFVNSIADFPIIEETI